MTLFDSSEKSILSFLQSAVLSWGVYFTQADALLVHCQHMLLEVISFTEKNESAAPYLLS